MSGRCGGQRRVASRGRGICFGRRERSGHVRCSHIRMKGGLGFRRLRPPYSTPRAVLLKPQAGAAVPRERDAELARQVLRRP